MTSVTHVFQDIGYPFCEFIMGLSTCGLIEKVGRSPVEGVFLEIGTGRKISVPLVFCYWEQAK